MDIYTVAFFGHRRLSDIFALEEQLIEILRELVMTKEYVEFLVGRDGDFDQLAASTVRSVIRNYGNGNASLILILPYDRAEYRDNKVSFEDYYDEVQICYESSIAHPKAAIEVRNRQMIDRSDLVICAVEHSGGAEKAMRYALRQGKKVINLLGNKQDCPL